MSVLVCTTYGDMPHPRYWMSLLGLKGHWQYKPLHGKQGVDAGHNELIEYFMSGGYEWMLHLDADAVVHPLTLERLLSWGELFVTALAFQRKPPYWPVLYMTEGDDWQRCAGLAREWLFDHFEHVKALDQPFVLADRAGALRPVDRGGAHCLLTHREVFEAIGPPWFVRDDIEARRGAGSDFYFYRMAMEAGFQPLIDLGVIAGHLQGDWCVGPMDYLVWDSVVSAGENEERININLRRYKHGTS